MTELEPRFDLIGYVERLDENSTADEINTALHYDFKREAIGYYAHVIEDEELRQKILKRTAEYQYIEEGSPLFGKSHAGLNWLRNAITSEIACEELKQKYGEDAWKTVEIFDCDRSPLAKELYKRLWDWENDDSVYQYGGDTINSFWGTYKRAISLYHPLQKVEGRSVKELDNLIRTFVMTNGVAQDEQLARFAILTHTIGNFMCCPRHPNGSPSYNVSKGNQDIIGDYPDMMFGWLNGKVEGEIFVKKDNNNVQVGDDTKKNWNDWVNQKKDDYFLDCYFSDTEPILLFRRTPDKIFPQNKEQLHEYLYRTNAIIELRGIKMLTALNPKLNDNSALKKKVRKLEKILSKRVCASKTPYLFPNEKTANRIENKYINTMGIAGRRSFYFTKNPIKRIKYDFTKAIHSFRYAPFFHGSRLLMYLATTAAAIMFFVTIVSLFTNGHFKGQIEAIKSSGLSDAFKNSYHSVSVPIYYNKYVFTGIIILFLIAFTCLYIDYFIDSAKGKRTIMIIVNAVAAVMCVIPTSIYLYFKHLGALYKNGKLDENSVQFEMFEKILNMLANKTVLIVYGGICLSAIIAFLLILVFSHVRPLIKTLVLSAAVIYLALPSILLFIENLIPIFLWVLAAIGVVIGLCLVFSVFGSGSGEKSEEVPSSHSSSQISKPVNTPPPQTGPQPIIKKIDTGCKLRFVKGVMHDYIQVYNFLGDSEICSLYEWKNKKVLVERGGRILGDADVEW